MNLIQYFLLRIGTVLLLLVFYSNPIKAQLENNVRIELPIVNSTDVYRDVFPLGADGLLLLTRNNPLFERNVTWSFTRYSTDLKVKWNADFKPNIKFSPVISFYNDYHAYWLFVVPDSKQHMFLQVNLLDGSIDVREGDLLAGIDVQEFKVLGSKALIAGYYRGRPIVVVYSFFDQSMHVLPGLFEKSMEINSIDIDEATGEINVLTYAYRKRHCQFEIKTYDYEGKLLRNTVLRDERNSIISGQMLSLNEDNTYLIGNYSVGCSQYSQGVYLSRLEEEEENWKADFIEFSDLQNFFNYMKPKRKEKTLEKVGRRKSLGKENRFRYRLLVHRLIESEDEIVLVAEVYYPFYKTTSSPYITAGSFSRNYVRIDDGYRYTHAIVCGFDKNGTLKWDNSFALKNLSSNTLQEKVQLTKVGKYYVLAYPDEDGIHTEVIHQNKTVTDKEKFEFNTGLSYEKVVDHESSTVLAWYDQYFMSYGTQRVKMDRQIKSNQNSVSEGPQREVFYIQKLSYNTAAIDSSAISSK